MPTVVDHATSPAPPEDVWKLLYDPARFPEWWAGMDRVELGSESGDYTYWYRDHPAAPMPQRMTTRRDDSRVTISCLVSSVEFEWRLAEEAEGTRIDVTAAVPDEAPGLERQIRELVGASVRRLAEVAATGAPPAPG
jgi:uncharacterized protein YndB with AHSA1/START domain